MMSLSLSLSFTDGRVAESGKDVVGRFEFSGRYDLEMGRMRSSKQYAKSHRVKHLGANQGDAEWLLGSDHSSICGEDST